MTTKEEFKAFFDTERESRKWIEKYEENTILFNHWLKSDDIEDVQFAISVKIYYYASPLRLLGYYTKALSVACEIVKELEGLKKDPKQYETYSEEVLFLQGLCLANLKRYRESNKYFKQLVEKNPTNDNYIAWYKSNRKVPIEKFFFNTAMVLLIAYVLSAVLRVTNVVSFVISDVIFTLWLIAMLLCWAAGYIVPKIIDKQNIKTE